MAGPSPYEGRKLRVPSPKDATQSRIDFLRDQVDRLRRLYYDAINEAREAKEMTCDLERRLVDSGWIDPSTLDQADGFADRSLVSIGPVVVTPDSEDRFYQAKTNTWWRYDPDKRHLVKSMPPAIEQIADQIAGVRERLNVRADVQPYDERKPEDVAQMMERG